MKTLLERCLCGSAAIVTDGLHGIPVFRCPTCGVVRQHVPFTLEELAAWYAARYYEGIYTHTLRHDRTIAAIRLHAYGVLPGAKLLDVGCGNGAFVDAAREQGVDAWGQDLAKQSDGPYVYVGELADIAFPTADFHVVTIHDVLEHVPDPMPFLAEIRRILKPGGMLIVDFPRFWDESGVHHWKKIEHLWMLTEAQLLALLHAAGFVGDTGLSIQDVCHPLPSKIVVRCFVPAVHRTGILVPAGIGDAYWVIAKLPGFMREHGITEPPAIYVQDAGGPKRTEPFIRTIPFVQSAGYVPLRTRNHIWKEAYLQDARTVFEKPFSDEAPEIDWFIAYNGVMRFGKSLHTVDPQWVPEWHPKMHVSKEALAFKKEAQEGGPYALAYFTDGGMYRKWLEEFPPEQLHRTLKLFEERLGLRIMFMGAEWDREMTGERLAQHEPSWIDLVGVTTYDQMIGAIMGASLVFGYPAGNTILASVLRVPSILLWNDYFDHRFWLNACPPVNNYVPLDTHGLTPEAVATAAETLLGTADYARQLAGAR